MAETSLARFYTDDHDRLDGLLADFARLKSSDRERATSAFSAFKSGLEQHMAWEEAILFPEYDMKAGMPEESPTEELVDEHQEIRRHVEAIERMFRDGSGDTAAEESRLAKLLSAHNRTEEQELYPASDRLLDDAERAAVFEAMKNAAW